MTSFGHKAKQQHFMLKDDITFLNHGSYGAVPRSVFEFRLRLLEEQESDPNFWFSELAHKYHAENIAAVAKLIGANESNIVFVENTTSGFNHVIKSLSLKSCDVILVNSFTHKAIQFTCENIAQRTSAKIMILNNVELGLLNNCDDLTSKLDATLQHNSNIKLVLFDFISAVGIVYPVADFVKICKKYDVIVGIDGAHVPGQMAVNLEELGQLGVDFFVGNLHKWAYTCRGCAVLWVNPSLHDAVLPVVTSFQQLYAANDFRSRFVYNGTCDRTSFYTAKAGLDFIAALGGMETITSYASSLLDEAVNYLVKLWKTKKYPLPSPMEAPCLRLVRLPDLKGFPLPFETVPFDLIKSYSQVLRKRFRIATATFMINNEPWIRLSANIYNCLEDYHKLGDAICQLISEDNQ